jgi:hypothetical protein
LAQERKSVAYYSTMTVNKLGPVMLEGRLIQCKSVLSVLIRGEVF